MSVREKCSNPSGQKVKYDFRVNLFSIFIDNLNHTVDSATLWGVFKEFGRVRDVFVPTKFGFRKSGFAFSRFDSLEEAILIDKKANGMHVLGWHIVAKVANFGWSKRRSLSYGRKSQSFDERIGIEGLRREGFQSGYFADVVRGNHKGIKSLVVRKEEEMLTMKWSSQEMDHVWIKRCAVGILKQFSDVSSVNQRLWCRGFKFSSAYIGDKSILWSTKGDEWWPKDASGDRVIVAKSGSVGAAKMRVADVSVRIDDLWSNGLNGEVAGSCVGKVGEPSDIGKASNIRCLDRKDSKLVLQESESLGKGVIKEKGCLDSQNSESTCSSVIKESNEVSKIGKVRVVNASCGRGVCTKVRVGRLAESGDGTVLGGKAVLRGSSDGKRGKGIVKGGVSSKSIRIFGSNDGSDGGVSVSGDQINFEKGKGLLGPCLSPMGSDLGGPDINLFVDLGIWNLFFGRGRGRWGKLLLLRVLSIEGREKMIFPSRIHRMKTRSGVRDFNFDGVEEELVDRIAKGK
ncbi:hypothetical protein Dsin_032528 [Dipteronia sinensis]|uniref:RRM domain-containing protein n=1 Tax=Dipteronia sinensis TaxID=43782 RepID=A0AAD9Z630_9ROSI|nr:hypothetical protein Dsin_032528 [Dipteronia sinensis]